MTHIVISESIYTMCLPRRKALMWHKCCWSKHECCFKTSHFVQPRLCSKIWSAGPIYIVRIILPLWILLYEGSFFSFFFFFFSFFVFYRHSIYYQRTACQGSSMLQMNLSAWAGLPEPTKESVARSLPWEHPQCTQFWNGSAPFVNTTSSILWHNYCRVRDFTVPGDRHGGQSVCFISPN